MEKTIIVAVGRKGEIGKDNDLLWHLPEDMKFFKETTQDSIVVMGRKNWDSIPERFRPLKNRINVVITKNKEFSAEGAEVFHDWKTCMDFCASTNKETVFIIGGAQIYKLALASNDVDRMLITYVDGDFDADTFFPSWNPEEWESETIKTMSANENNPYSFTIKEYKRK
jgi:dihydrofolate reductase